MWPVSPFRSEKGIEIVLFDVSKHPFYAATKYHVKGIKRQYPFRLDERQHVSESMNLLPERLLMVLSVKLDGHVVYPVMKQLFFEQIGASLAIRVCDHSYVIWDADVKALVAKGDKQRILSGRSAGMDDWLILDVHALLLPLWNGILVEDPNLFLEFEFVCLEQVWHGEPWPIRGDVAEVMYICMISNHADATLPLVVEEPKLVLKEAGPKILVQGLLYEQLFVQKNAV
jgi:hypothetical protein